MRIQTGTRTRPLLDQILGYSPLETDLLKGLGTYRTSTRYFKDTTGIYIGFVKSISDLCPFAYIVTSQQPAKYILFLVACTNVAINSGNGFRCRVHFIWRWISYFPYSIYPLRTIILVCFLYCAPMLFDEIPCRFLQSYYSVYLKGKTLAAENLLQQSRFICDSSYHISRECILENKRTSYWKSKAIRHHQ